jgi:hypothetical protein
MTDPAYESPALAEIGSLHDLTLVTITKSGSHADILTGINIPGNGPIGPGSHVTVTP